MQVQQVGQVLSPQKAKQVAEFAGIPTTASVGVCPVRHTNAMAWQAFFCSMGGGGQVGVTVCPVRSCRLGSGKGWAAGGQVPAGQVCQAGRKSQPRPVRGKVPGTGEVGCWLSTRHAMVRPGRWCWVGRAGWGLLAWGGGICWVAVCRCCRYAYVQVKGGQIKAWVAGGQVGSPAGNQSMQPGAVQWVWGRSNKGSQVGGGYKVAIRQ